VSFLMTGYEIACPSFIHLILFTTLPTLLYNPDMIHDYSIYLYPRT
jgi:hypothetical protein